MFRKEARDYFEGLAREYPGWKQKNLYYYSKLTQFYKRVIPPGKDVLEIGCRDGELLKAVEPRNGIGIDASEEMIEIAKRNCSGLSFFPLKDSLELEGKFDYIIMSNVIGYVSDLWLLFEQIKPLTKPDTKIIISGSNPLMEPLIKLGEILGLKSFEGPVNRFYPEDIINLLRLNDFEIADWGYELPLPKKVPFLSEMMNRYASRVRFWRNLSFLQYIIARPGENISGGKFFSCSVIIPCHNEKENIGECIERVPSLGKATEIVIVDDGSTDSTVAEVRKIRRKNPGRDLKLISHFPNRGKGFTVREGFKAASGDVLMILDADMAVPPEELPRFFRPIADGKAEAVNGTRMVYMMEKQAMPYLHLFGNKIFSLIFTWLMGRRITDTLCGTKAILRKDFERMEMGRCPWGDFDILVGISKLGLKMVEMPVHYKVRKAGKSKMKTFRHGLLLVGMCLYGFKELKLKKWSWIPFNKKRER